MAETRKRLLLSVDRCSKHGYYAVNVSIVDSTGTGGGVRLTPGKCCGSWGTKIKEWDMTPEQLREAADTLTGYADEFEQTVRQPIQLRSPDGGAK